MKQDSLITQIYIFLTLYFSSYFLREEKVIFCINFFIIIKIRFDSFEFI